VSELTSQVDLVLLESARALLGNASPSLCDPGTGSDCIPLALGEDAGDDCQNQKETQGKRQRHRRRLWNCPVCGNVNLAMRSECSAAQCGTPRPENSIEVEVIDGMDCGEGQVVVNDKDVVLVVKASTEDGGIATEN